MRDDSLPSIIPKRAGRLLSGVEFVMISKPPFNIPAAPSPDTALPIMNIVEFLATPHNSEPSSNTPRKSKKVYYDTKSQTKSLEFLEIFQIRG